MKSLDASARAPGGILTAAGFIPATGDHPLSEPALTIGGIALPGAESGTPLRIPVHVNGVPFLVVRIFRAGTPRVPPTNRDTSSVANVITWLSSGAHVTFSRSGANILRLSSNGATIANTTTDVYNVVAQGNTGATNATVRLERLLYKRDSGGAILPDQYIRETVNYAVTNNGITQSNRTTQDVTTTTPDTYLNSLVTGFFVETPQMYARQAVNLGIVEWQTTDFEDKVRWRTSQHLMVLDPTVAGSPVTPMLIGGVQPLAIEREGVWMSKPLPASTATTVLRPLINTSVQAPTGSEGVVYVPPRLAKNLIYENGNKLDGTPFPGFLSAPESGVTLGAAGLKLRFFVSVYSPRVPVTLALRFKDGGPQGVISADVRQTNGVTLKAFNVPWILSSGLQLSGTASVDADGTFTTPSWGINTVEVNIRSTSSADILATASLIVHAP